MREKFKEHRFQQKSRELLDLANPILSEYRDQGFKVSVRQVYYQLIARGLLENTKTNYARLLRVFREGRRAGEVDWDMIADHTRELQTYATYDDPADRIRSAAGYYHEDLWRDQRYRPEVWIEKLGLVDVIEPVCDDLTVNHIGLRGNNSITILKQAAERFTDTIGRGQEPIVLFLSDHDPTGLLTMEQVYRRDLTQFARQDIELRRIALTKEQVRRYRAPPNPVKKADSRSARYIAEFGEKCWELDVLTPQVLQEIIRTELNKLIDHKKWKAAQRKEQANRELIEWVGDNWSKVEKLKEVE